MNRSPAGVAIAAALVVAVLTFGCASPPEAERKAAEQAVNAAKSAGADRYAAADFKAAEQAWSEAESHMNAKKYGEAKAAYVRVKELAEKAAKGVETGKAAMKAAAEQTIADAEKRWQELEGKVKAAARKLKAEQKRAWDADAKAAGEALSAAKAALAAEPAAVKEKLGTVTATLEKWEADLKAMAEAAKQPAKKK